ncbi:MAG: hypothetical protein COA47_14165 [Robiginitomaculum sp.]|nr:MAG: hypothetical protein COA47_14165 [Robiginitomaculum sp.]
MANSKPPKPKRKPAAPAKPKSAKTEAAPVTDGIHPAARPFLWVGNHGVQRGFIWLVGALMLVFIGLDYTFNRHGHFSWEAAKGFYAIFGFLAFTFVVLMGWPLRKWTGRPETYYGDGPYDGADEGEHDV